MRKLKRWYIPVIVLVVLLLCCYGFVAIVDKYVPRYEYGVGVTTSLGEGYYQIDPENILTSIDSGEVDIFKPLAVTPEVPFWETDTPIQWGQADYLRIAETFHEFVWGESLEDWNIETITFGLQCEDVNSGPQVAYFVLFKRVNENGREVRIKRLIYISPYQDSILWTSSKTDPDQWTFQAIDLKKHTVLVEDVIRIAEENGGKEVRSQVNDDCIIRLHLHSSQEQEDNWSVFYYPAVSGPDLLEMDIDPITGEF